MNTVVENLLNPFYIMETILIKGKVGMIDVFGLNPLHHGTILKTNRTRKDCSVPVS